MLWNHTPVVYWLHLLYVPVSPKEGAALTDGEEGSVSINISASSSLKTEHKVGDSMYIHSPLPDQAQRGCLHFNACSSKFTLALCTCWSSFGSGSN